MRYFLKLALVVGCFISATCKRYSEQIEHTSRQYVIVTEDGEFVYSVDVTWWEKGENMVQIGLWLYPWQGEDTLEYRIEENLLWVRDTAVGIDLTGKASIFLPEPNKITTVIVDGAHLSQVAGYKDLKALTVYDLDRVVDIFSSTRLSSHLKADLTPLTELGDLKALVLEDTRITDEDMKYIGNLAELRELWMSSDYFFLVEKDITSSGLAQLKDLDKLHTLDLRNIWIGEAGLAVLEGLSNLEVLLLEDPCVYDRQLVHLESVSNLRKLMLRDDWNLNGWGLKYLRNLTKLEELDLSGCFYMDHENLWEEEPLEVRYIPKLPKLERLSLANTHLRDRSLKHISKLTNLIQLNLGNNPITDKGLKHLQKLTELTSLDLSSTDVTDTGLVYLEGLTNLRELRLNSTDVTEEGVNRLRNALPECEIRY
ncbi:hypothetical protein JXM67_13615 [candidate division WOR-3 bacterium]|nr:hypothetical protein [candidate division WOR-3 bacterium]